MPLPLHSIPRNPQIFTDRLRLRPVDNRLSKICGPGATISQSTRFISFLSRDVKACTQSAHRLHFPEERLWTATEARLPDRFRVKLLFNGN